MPGDGQQEVYKEHAAACLEIARKTDDREGKIALLGIARAWLALAEQYVVPCLQRSDTDLIDKAA
jgi:hypothetical protein